MAQDNAKINRQITVLFLVQTGLFLWGVFAREDDAIPSQQWVAWTLLFIITFVLGMLSLNMALNHQKFNQLTRLILVINAVAVGVALYVHYNPTLG